MSLLPDMRTLQTVVRELKAVATAALALPLRPVLSNDAYDPHASHPIPVVLVHGLCGDPTNFLGLKRALHSAGIANFATFAYRPQFAYPRLVSGLTETIEKTCRETGAPKVDIVAHSLGGLIARGVARSNAGTRVRRLLTLGSPYLSAELATQELAIFGASDALVPTPDAEGPHTRVVIVPDCGHVGLLYDPRVAATIISYLSAPAHALSSGRPRSGIARRPVDAPLQPDANDPSGTRYRGARRLGVQANDSALVRAEARRRRQPLAVLRPPVGPGAPP
jgi:pimeloyl-ACP methyl ester carboxylesterase